MSDQYSNMTAEQLRAEIARIKANNSTSGGIKVSQKGAISVYGMGRWPVTLYKTQMLRFLDKADEIREFIKANDDRLAVKDSA